MSFGGQPLYRDEGYPISGMIACSAVLLRAHGSRHSVPCVVTFLHDLSSGLAWENCGQVRRLAGDEPHINEGRKSGLVLFQEILRRLNGALDRQVISSIMTLRKI